MILKQGELFKTGQMTGLQISRYFILRDNALFSYKNRDQKYPSNIYPLRGLYTSYYKKKREKQIEQ